MWINYCEILIIKYQTGTQCEDTGGNCSNNASLLVLAHAAIQSNGLWLGGPQLMASVTSCHHTIGTMGCVYSDMNWPQEARLGVPATCQHVIQSIGLPEQGLLGVWEAAEVVHLFATDTKPFQTISLSCWVYVSKRGEQVDNTVYNLWSQPFHHQGLHSMLSSVQNTTGNRVMVRRPSSWQSISSPILAFPWSFNTLANTSRK